MRSFGMDSGIVVDSSPVLSSEARFQSIQNLQKTQEIGVNDRTLPLHVLYILRLVAGSSSLYSGGIGPTGAAGMDLLHSI
jgi:hypothetical protein